jgi:phosphate transport system permease protein
VTTLDSPPPVKELSASAPSPRRPRRVRALTGEEWLALVGSALASVALVTIGYEHILDFSGTVGFLFCLYLTFITVYGVVLSVSTPRQVVVERLVTVTLWLAAALVIFALGTTVVYTFFKGWRALVHTNFYSHDMAGVAPTAPLSQGGIFHAIVGSVIEVGIAVAISVPLGIATAVFMMEVGGRGSRLVRTVVESMTALPEILAGLFVYVVLIVEFGLAKSGLAVSVAMAVTMVPIIARAGEVALRVVPGGVLPSARTGLATAVILAIARGVGETAIPLVTSGASSFLTFNPTQVPMNSLPLYIYSAYTTHEPTAVVRAFGAASVLLIMVLGLFVVMRIILRERKAR